MFRIVDMVLSCLIVRDRGAAVLRNETAVDAVEMFDNASLIQSRDISEDLVKLVDGLGEVRS